MSEENKEKKDKGEVRDLEPKKDAKGGYRAPEELDSAFNQLIKARNNKPELYNLVKGMYLAEGSPGAQTTK